jgi:hypothetical protein
MQPLMVYGLALMILTGEILIKNTVKPVYNGHPWDPKKVAIVQRVAVVQRLV